MRDEVAYKTKGLCAPCFRDSAHKVIDAAMVVVAGRERIVLRSKRKPAELAQRARARKRNRQRPEVKEQHVKGVHCAERARRRLAKLLPELFEILLADERAAAGLNAFTIDRCLRPGTLDTGLDFLMDYRHLHDDTDGGAAA